MVLQHLEGIVNCNHRLSRRMLALLPPSYRNGEDEGEEADSSEEEEESGEVDETAGEVACP
eukprot:2303051-Pleurochrysis_carterae.AAC.2